MTNEFWKRPCAAPGLVSFRYRGLFGWIMIGARDVSDALREAERSIEGKAHIRNLEIWNGTNYVAL